MRAETIRGTTGTTCNLIVFFLLLVLIIELQCWLENIWISTFYVKLTNVFYYSLKVNGKYIYLVILWIIPPHISGYTFWFILCINLKELFLKITASFRKIEGIFSPKLLFWMIFLTPISRIPIRSRNGKAASIAQWQSTGLVNQGSWVRISLEAVISF